MRMSLALVACTIAGPAVADMVVPTRPIGAMEIIAADAVMLASGSIAGAPGELDAVIGREARVALYPGQPVLSRHLSAPAIIERNTPVTLIFDMGGLRIAAEGRALGRGGAGDQIRVMNVASKVTLYGTIREDGSVAVSR